MPNEKLVKTKIKQALDARGWTSWPVMQNGYGVSGMSDRIALRDGCFMAIEAKFHPGKPSPMQKKFLRQVRSQNAFAFVVDDKTFDVFVSFLDAFDRARDAHPLDATDKDKQTMISAIAILVAPFMSEELKHAEQRETSPVGEGVHGDRRSTVGPADGDEED